jgi:D-glycero-D-manno-heptose 1,7-bisphosphate phosphatase
VQLIILDRDGVINEDSDDYIKTPDEWRPIAGSMQAIARLHRAGYRVVVATNQSGLARGLFDVDALTAIHAKMNNTVSEAGGHIDAVFFCPHGPDDGCTCRKPATGLLEDIRSRLGISLEGVPCVGDSLRDITSARDVTARPILVRTGKGRRTLKSKKNVKHLKDVAVYDDLAGAVEALLAEDAALQGS